MENVASPGMRWCLSVFLVMRLALTLWGVLVLRVYPLEVDWHASVFAFYKQAVPGGYGGGDRIWDAFLWPWYRWDTVWYLKIAREGYNVPDGRVAFAPIYPLLIRGLGGLLHGHYLLAALLISNLAALLSCLLLYQESSRLFDWPMAQRTVLYFLSFPTAFFLVAGYTESLFMLLMLLTWRAATREKWGWVGLWGTMAVLTRFQGLALLVVLAWLWWQSNASRMIRGFILLTIPSAFFAWALYIRLGLGGEFPWDALSQVWNQHMGWPWEGLVHNALALCGWYPGVSPNLSIFLDLFVVVLFAGLIVVAFRSLPKRQTLLMASLFIVSLVKLSDQGLLVSASRYLFSLFPGFILLARAGRRRWFHWCWICLSFFLQAIGSAAFFLWAWVA